MLLPLRTGSKSETIGRWDAIGALSVIIRSIALITLHVRGEETDRLSTTWTMLMVRMDGGFALGTFYVLHYGTGNLGDLWI